MSTPDGGFRAAPQLDLTPAMGAELPGRFWPRLADTVPAALERNRDKQALVHSVASGSRRPKPVLPAMPVES